MKSNRCLPSRSYSEYGVDSDKNPGQPSLSFSNYHATVSHSLKNYSLPLQGFESSIIVWNTPVLRLFLCCQRKHSKRGTAAAKPENHKCSLDKHSLHEDAFLFFCSPPLTRSKDPTSWVIGCYCCGASQGCSAYSQTVGQQAGSGNAHMANDSTPKLLKIWCLTT
ncbi:hypothetical protein BJY04DRAFT_201633 [Aspergillus karnatakaensis]|uniref:uncharacterized protein n=1 Tax=Aspergillus karnatakaensis TaxID=1810916 RepID=UPI003CCCD9B2